MFKLASSALLLVLISLSYYGTEAAPASKAPNTTSELCPQGFHWSSSDGCNICTCHPDTGRIGCTLTICQNMWDIAVPYKKSIVKTMGTRDPFFVQEDICPRGLTFLSDDGCGNVCRCNPENGFVGCTKRGCEVRHRPLPSKKDAHVEDDLCPRGLIFPSDDGCNSCTCNPENGVVACTKRGCRVRVRPPTNMWEIAVPYSKSIYSKSLMKTAKTAELDECERKRCPEGLSFPAGDGCNSCFCNPETGATGCTLMGCTIYTLESAVKSLSTLKSSEGANACSTYVPMDPCGDCFCNPESGMVECSIWGGKKSLSHTKQMKTAEENCPRGLSFPADDGCNSCFCVPENGAVGCTKMRCPEPQV